MKADGRAHHGRSAPRCSTMLRTGEAQLSGARREAETSIGHTRSGGSRPRGDADGLLAAASMAPISRTGPESCGYATSQGWSSSNTDSTRSVSSEPTSRRRTDPLDWNLNSSSSPTSTNLSETTTLANGRRQVPDVLQGQTSGRGPTTSSGGGSRFATESMIGYEDLRTGTDPERVMRSVGL